MFCIPSFHAHSGPEDRRAEMHPKRDPKPSCRWASPWVHTRYIQIKELSLGLVDFWILVQFNFIQPAHAETWCKLCYSPCDPHSQLKDHFHIILRYKASSSKSATVSLKAFQILFLKTFLCINFFFLKNKKLPKIRLYLCHLITMNTISPWPNDTACSTPLHPAFPKPNPLDAFTGAAELPCFLFATQNPSDVVFPSNLEKGTEKYRFWQPGNSSAVSALRNYCRSLWQHQEQAQGEAPRALRGFPPYRLAILKATAGCNSCCQEPNLYLDTGPDAVTPTGEQGTVKAEWICPVFPTCTHKIRLCVTRTASLLLGIKVSIWNSFTPVWLVSALSFHQGSYSTLLIKTIERQSNMKRHILKNKQTNIKGAGERKGQNKRSMITKNPRERATLLDHVRVREGEQKLLKKEGYGKGRRQKNTRQVSVCRTAPCQPPKQPSPDPDRSFLARFSHTPPLPIQGIKSTNRKANISTTVLWIWG